MDRSTKVKLHTGRTMPVLGLGTWELTKDTAEAVQSALDIGYRMIDTSGDYGSQPGIAEGLRRASIPRDDIFIVTKIEETENAYESAKRNVGELGLENADLILIHRPPEFGAGERLWDGLLRAREEGITKDIGVSNYGVERIDALIETSGETPVVNQVEWSPFGFTDEMLTYCRQKGIVVQAYSPLTHGERLDDPGLQKIARVHGKTPAQVVLRWNLQLGTVPLPKASRAKHQKENFEVFDFVLSDDEMTALSDMNQHYSALGDELQYA
jgi:2,5-diketo-D-gluconate reductase A